MAKKTASARRVSTLMKKAMELSILCEVSVCVICYGTDGDLHCWPENPRPLVTKYRRLRDEDRKKHCVDLEGFLETETIKAETAKNRKKNDKRLILESTGEMDPDWDERIDGFSDEELRALMSRLDDKLVQLTAKLNGMMGSEALSESERTNDRPPGVDSDNVDLIQCSSHTEEPRVHHIKGAQKNDCNLAADDSES